MKHLDAVVTKLAQISFLLIVAIIRLKIMLLVMSFRVLKWAVMAYQAYRMGKRASVIVRRTKTATHVTYLRREK